MGLYTMSSSVWPDKTPAPLPVGRIVFDSASDREAAFQRRRKPFVPAMTVPVVVNMDVVDRVLGVSLADIRASEQAAARTGTGPSPSPSPDNPNPNPRHFVVLRAVETGRHVVVLVRYPGCTTYEGQKVLVLAETTEGDVRAAEVLDPHFTNGAPAGALVPVARFEPTDRGWRLAMLCAAAL